MLLQQTQSAIPQPIYLMGPALLWQVSRPPGAAAVIATIRGMDSEYVHARGLDTQYIRLRGRD